jgi:mRNA-degrading endonuclease toxin of MazEF toxin-antitoxin module
MISPRDQVPTRTEDIEAPVHPRVKTLGFPSAGLCNNLATVYEDRIDRIIGYLPAALMSRLDECLKATLGLL